MCRCFRRQVSRLCCKGSSREAWSVNLKSVYRAPWNLPRFAGFLRKQPSCLFLSSTSCLPLLLHWRACCSDGKKSFGRYLPDRRNRRKRNSSSGRWRGSQTVRSSAAERGRWIFHLSSWRWCAKAVRSLARRLGRFLFQTGYAQACSSSSTCRWMPTVRCHTGHAGSLWPYP